VAIVRVLRGYATKNGTGEYTAETVERNKIGTFPTAGAAQRAVDKVIGMHLSWVQQNATYAAGIERWSGYELRAP
jgi:hypothetical protein